MLDHMDLSPLHQWWLLWVSSCQASQQHLCVERTRAPSLVGDLAIARREVAI